MTRIHSENFDQEIILIVDDEEPVRELLSHILSDMGFTIQKAGSGEEALEKAMVHKPDMVLMDINLPGINGYETCRRLLEIYAGQNLPVIFVSGMDDQFKRAEIFRAGGIDYISKPFETEEVKAIVQAHTQNIRMQKQLQAKLRLLEAEIEERKKIEKEVRESRERLNMILEVVPTGIGITAPDGRILLANREIQNFHGYDLADEASGINVNDLYVDKAERKQFVALLKTGRVQNFEARFRHKNGDIRWGLLSSVSRKTEDGELQYITSVTDITHLKAMEKEKQTLQAQLLQSDKMVSIGQLAAGIAHEINNPVGFVSSNLSTLNGYYNQIGTFLKTCDESITRIKNNKDISEHTRAADQMELLKKKINMSFLLEDGQDILKDCMEGMNRIHKIVKDLKSFAHPGKTGKEYTDINAGLESTLSVVSNELKYKATVKTDFGPMPLISAFPQQLNQVFMNILINAAQAMDGKKGLGEIRIKTRHEYPVSRIEISDNGCGMSEEDQKKVFDPFFTTKEVGKGTGLGMNIAYGIIKNHHGEITVQSEKGKGTTFIITLPVHTTPHQKE